MLRTTPPAPASNPLTRCRRPTFSAAPLTIAAGALPRSCSSLYAEVPSGVICFIQANLLIGHSVQFEQFRDGFGTSSRRWFGRDSDIGQAPVPPSDPANVDDFRRKLLIALLPSRSRISAGHSQPDGKNAAGFSNA